MQALESESAVMAYVLAQARAQWNWDMGMLAAWLGMAVAQVPRLALCRRPEMADGNDADSVAALARYVGCDADRLRLLLVSFPAVGASAVPWHVRSAE